MTAPKQSESKFNRVSLCWFGYMEYAKGLEMNEEQAKSAIEYLNDTGYCLYWEDDLLKDNIFIDPQFVTRLLSTIITFSHNFVSDGKLRYGILNHIWYLYIYFYIFFFFFLDFLFDFFYDIIIFFI